MNPAIREDLTYERTRSGFVRGFSFWDVFTFVVATPAASGIVYYSVASKATFPGASFPLAFVFGIVLFLPVAMLLGATSSAVPRSGGIYVLISRLLSPALGQVAAWLLFVAYGLCIGMFGYIVVGILGGIVGMSGKGSLDSLAAFLMSGTGKVLGACIWVGLLWLIFRMGGAWIRNLLRVTVFVPLVAILVAIVAFLAVGPAGAQKAFDATWGQGAYGKVLTLAAQEGWSRVPFSLADTFAALLVVIWAYTTLEAVNYAGSEVRNPKTNFLRGFVAGVLAVGLLYVLVAVGVYHCFGDFVSAYAYVAAKSAGSLKTIMPAIDPSIPFYATSVLPAMPALLVSVALLLWFFNSMPGVFLASSRLAYALAADGVFPRRMQDVDGKRGVPIWATNATAGLGFLGILLMSLDLTQVLGVLNFCFLFVFWPYGLSAAILPFRAPEVFADCPFRKRIFGLPILSMLGAIVFLEGWYFLFLAVEGFGNWGALVTLVILLLGLAVQLRYRRKHQVLGSDGEAVFRQIPLD